MKPATPLQEAAERVRVARTFAAIHQDEASLSELRAALTAFNVMLPANAPMSFACIACGEVFEVPENYVMKPERCPSCGGPWSRP